MKCNKCGYEQDVVLNFEGAFYCSSCGSINYIVEGADTGGFSMETDECLMEDRGVELAEEAQSRVGINRKIYPLDLAESYGFGPEFAAGMVIDLVSKFRHHDEQEKLEKASWYLSRLICQMYGANAARKAMESFNEGIE